MGNLKTIVVEVDDALYYRIKRMGEDSNVSPGNVLCVLARHELATNFVPRLGSTQQEFLEWVRRDKVENG